MATTYTSSGPEKVGYGGSEGVQLGNSTSDLVGFYGTAPIALRASAAQGALVSASALVCGVGFPTSAAFVSFTNQLENIRASLVALGLLKGSA
jgi:hypothetical protein